MSGSRLVIDGETAGMRLSVNSAGMGRVMRQDHLDNVLAALFVESGRPAPGGLVCVMATEDARLFGKEIERRLEDGGFRARRGEASTCDARVHLEASLSRSALMDGGHQVLAELAFRTEQRGQEPRRGDLELRGYSATGYDGALRGAAAELRDELERSGLWSVLGFD